MSILPCPNPECRGECEVRHEDLTDTPWGMMRNYWVECWKEGGEESCLYRGPVDQSEKIAIEKHNAMPREAEWVIVGDNLRKPKADDIIDVVWRHGTWAEPFVYEGAHYLPDANSPFRSAEGIPFLNYQVTHWRIHTPPRMPKR